MSLNIKKLNQSLWNEMLGSSKKAALLKINVLQDCLTYFRFFFSYFSSFFLVFITAIMILTEAVHHRCS